MKYMLDTNICIYVINERPKKVLNQFSRFRLWDLGVSSVTVAELAYGVAKSGSARNHSALQAFLLPVNIPFFDTSAAMAYCDLRANLEKRRQPIGPLDFQIAAHALSLNTVLLTNNVREFRKVSGLTVENWV